MHMKHLLLMAAGWLLIAACNSGGGRQSDNVAAPEFAAANAETEATAVAIPEEPQRPDLDMDEAMELLRELAESIAAAESVPQSMDTMEEEAVAKEELAEEVDAEPVRVLKWYEKDFSMTVMDLDGGGTYTFTRKGKKLYIKSEAGGDTRLEDMDILDNGTLRSYVTKNGTHTRTYTMESTPEQVLKNYLSGTKTDLKVIAGYPSSPDTRIDTRCGRPCLVITKVTEENIMGYSTRKEDVYYVDKEYGFIYEKLSSASGNVGVNFKNMTHFRVTAFTDTP